MLHSVKYRGSFGNGEAEICSRTRRTSPMIASGDGSSFVSLCPFFIEKAAMDAVGMRGHKVDCGAALLHVRKELGNPCRSGSGWAPHPQRGID